MKYKKTITCVAVALVSIVLGSVVAASGIFETKGAELMNGEPSVISANTSLQRVYSTDELRFLAINPVGDIYPMSIAPRTLAQVNQFYPVEYSATVNNELIYVVCKIHNNGLDYFIYMFFSKDSDVNARGRSENDSWILSGRAFTISRSLEYSDFAHIKVGSILSDVAEIEPLAMQRKPLDYIEAYTGERFDEELDDFVEDTIQPPELIEYDDYFYLRDGILRISFNKPNKPGGDYTVTDIVFDKDFKVSVDNFNAGGLLKSQMQLRIFEKDFPLLSIN